MMSAVFAIRLLLPERHAEVREECLRVLVGPCRRDDADIHAATLVDLVVDDLGEDHLLAEPERVVATPVEPLRWHALEVADARQRDVDEPVEELVHPRALRPPLRDGRALRGAFALPRLSLHGRGGLAGLWLRCCLRRVLGHGPNPCRSARRTACRRAPCGLRRAP